MAFKSCALFGLLALARFTGAKEEGESVSPTPSPSSDSATNATKTMDTPSLNEAIPKPECDANFTVSIRYSATTGRLYLEGVDGARGGCVTIDQVWEARGGGSKGGAKAPLYAVDPVSGNYSDVQTGTWLLEEDLYVQDGVTLKVRKCRIINKHIQALELYQYMVVSRGVLGVVRSCRHLPASRGRVGNASLCTCRKCRSFYCRVVLLLLQSRVQFVRSLAYRLRTVWGKIRLVLYSSVAC